ncbi:MAG: CapA family protein [Nocardioidaceae bacterium]
MNGDVLLHEGLWATARADAERTGRGTMDFRPLLADMRPVVSSADLAICHLETPLAPRGGPYSGYPLFSVPPAIVPALRWEGYDACTTASNHSLDQGFEGLTRTLDDFDRAGLETAGTAATRRASRQPLIMDVAGVQVALISATYGTNGLPLPAEQPWSVPIIDTDAIVSMAAKARARGAEIVLVALHWGLEYTHAPIQDQLDVADALTRSPLIDLVYGHHAHVVQPYDKVHGTWVVYGLGNAVAQQDTDVEGVYDGNTCRVTFEEKADGSFKVAALEYIPTMITRYDGVHPMRWLDVPRDLDDPHFAALRGSLRATEARVRRVVGSLGAFRAGVTEGR